MRILIIADDLSGAADCAIGFASGGHRTLVLLDAPDGTRAAPQPSAAHAEASAQAIAVDTDTRRAPAAEAAQRTAAVYQALRADGQRLYKKIDSTLRGNWAAEVAALQRLAGLAIVAPAFPATGRTLSGGRVLVHGVPLERTETWQLEHQGCEADVAAMLAQAGLSTQLLDAEAWRDNADALARQIAAMAANGTQALVVDAQSEAALRTLAHVTLSSDVPLFWVGSGGLAREIASLTAQRNENALQQRDQAPRSGAAAAASTTLAKSPRSPKSAILVMVGSLSAVSIKQSEILRERGSLMELVVPPTVLRTGAAHAQWSAWATRIGDALSAGEDLLLRIGKDDAFDPAEGAKLSAALATLVEPHFGKACALIATGGETARAMLSAARIDGLELVAEVEAGVAIGRPLGEHAQHCAHVVTKAGAFGTENALYSAWQRLRDERAATLHHVPSETSQ